MRDDRGFTLLEVLVSLAILAAVLVIGYQVMTGAVAAADRSGRWTRAALLGEALLRETLPKYPPVGQSSDKFPAPDDGFGWKVTVTESVYSKARQVDVTVTDLSRADGEAVTVTGIAFQ